MGKKFSCRVKFSLWRITLQLPGMIKIIVPNDHDQQKTKILFLDYGGFFVQTTRKPTSNEHSN
jgi:hypothetical protein